MTYKVRHQTGSNVFIIEVPDVAQMRPSDMGNITNVFDLSDVGQWLRDNKVEHDLAMSGRDFIGRVYLILNDPNDAVLFKMTWC